MSTTDAVKKPMNRTATANERLFKELNGWHPELIKTEVRMRGTNLTQLGLEHGLHRTT